MTIDDGESGSFSCDTTITVREDRGLLLSSAPRLAREQLGFLLIEFILGDEPVRLQLAQLRQFVGDR